MALDYDSVLAELPKDWQKTALAMYDSGASDREVMRELGLTPTRWRILEQSLTGDFPEVVELGRMLAHAWWETLGRKSVLDKDLNTPLYVAVMKNRFGWSEKQNDPNVSAVDGKNLSDEDLNRMVKDLMAKWEQARGKTVL
jgi:hypothetical protein